VLLHAKGRGGMGLKITCLSGWMGTRFWYSSAVAVGDVTAVVTLGMTVDAAACLSITDRPMEAFLCELGR